MSRSRTEPRPATVVLVGTYKGDQLDRWPGWYCWPLAADAAKQNAECTMRNDGGVSHLGEPSAADNFPRAETRKRGGDKHTDLLTPNGVREDMSRVGSEQIRVLKQITELWLFQGTKAQKTYRAEFVGIKTREELIRDYGYPAKGKPHGDRYALFKTELLYTPTETAETVIVRTRDFAKRSPKIAAQLKAYLESRDRNNPDLAKFLPAIIVNAPKEHLRVCEAAVQLDFMDRLGGGLETLQAKRKEKRSKRFTCLDFFAGSGLVSSAVSGQFETVWANDISEKKALVFNSNIKTNVLEVCPIEQVDGSTLPSVDLSWGSFPCQDLSLAGDMNGLYASRSGLFWQWLRVMDEMDERPPVVVAENVVGLVSVEGGKYYKAVHEELEKRGYAVGAVLLDAILWVPQSRKRIFVIAVQKDMDISAFVCNHPIWCHPAPVMNVASKVKHWIWWNLPEPPARSKTIADIIDFNAPCDGEEERNNKLKLISKDKFDFMVADSQKSRKVYTGYRRTRNHRQVLEVRTDGIAGCLRTPCGGSSRQILLIAENGGVKTRLLTVRETARLMGAPDSFNLPGSYNDGYMAMGDGVAFPVAKYLSEQLLAPLARMAL